MKRVILMLAAAGLAASTSLAQLAPGQPGLTPQDGNLVALKPKISLDRPSHNFGQILDDAPVKTTVRFKNVGGGVLKIVDLKGSCGCTVPQLQKREYAPGEVGEVEVTYNPHGRKGPQSTNVTITSNDSDMPNAVFQLQSTVIKLVDFDPPAASFMNYSRGKPATTKIVVRGRTPDFKITGIEGLDADLFETKMSDPVDYTFPDGARGKEIAVEVTLKGAPASGWLTRNAVLRTTDPRAATATMQVMAQVLADVMVKPAQVVSLGALKPNSPYKAEVLVEHRIAGTSFNLTGKKFENLSISEPGMPNFQPGKIGEPIAEPKVEIEPAKDPGKYIVRISGTTPAKTGHMRGDVLLQTDVAGEPSVRVSFFAVVNQDAGQPKPIIQGVPAQPAKPGETIVKPVKQ